MNEDPAVALLQVGGLFTALCFLSLLLRVWRLETRLDNLEADVRARRATESNGR